MPAMSSSVPALVLSVPSRRYVVGDLLIEISNQPRAEASWATRPRSAECERTGGPIKKKWRRGWDSNPRYGYPYTRFPSVLLKPLGHLSTSHSCRRSSHFACRTSPFSRFPDASPRLIPAVSCTERGPGNLANPASGYGGGGIRTHVPSSSPDNPISSRARYDHFGTPPYSCKRVTLEPSFRRQVKSGSALDRAGKHRTKHGIFGAA